MSWYMSVPLEWMEYIVLWVSNRIFSLSSIFCSTLIWPCNLMTACPSSKNLDTFPLLMPTLILSIVISPIYAHSISSKRVGWLDVLLRNDWCLCRGISSILIFSKFRKISSRMTLIRFTLWYFKTQHIMSSIYFSEVILYLNVVILEKF